MFLKGGVVPVTPTPPSVLLHDTALLDSNICSMLFLKLALTYNVGWIDVQEKKERRVAGWLRRKGGCKQRTIRQSENAQRRYREHLAEWLAGPKRRRVDCK